MPEYMHDLETESRRLADHILRTPAKLIGESRDHRQYTGLFDDPTPPDASDLKRDEAIVTDRYRTEGSCAPLMRSSFGR